MAKWIVAEKNKAGLRHSVVCPNVTGRTKEMIAQTKRARAGSLALVDKWRELVPSGRLVCTCHHVFLWRHVCFVLLCFASFFRFYYFVEAAALRSIVLRYYAGAPTATRVFVFGEVAFPEFFLLYHSCFLLVV